MTPFWSTEAYVEWKRARTQVRPHVPLPPLVVETVADGQQGHLEDIVVADERRHVEEVSRSSEWQMPRDRYSTP